MEKPASQITVAIPTCGIRPSLWETIDSVLSCERYGVPHEIIISVNGRDGSETCAEAIRARYPQGNFRLLVHQQDQQLSMAQNWNACIRACESPFLHILHDDDRVAANFYAEMDLLIRKFPGAALYYCGIIVFDDESDYSKVTTAEGWWTEALSEMVNSNRLLCPGVVFDRNKCGSGFDEVLKYCVDWKAWYELIREGGMVATPVPLAYYRVHSQSASLGLRRAGEDIREVAVVEMDLAEDYKRVRGIAPERRHLFSAMIGYSSAVNFIANGHYRIGFTQMLRAMKREFLPRRVLACVNEMVKTILFK